MPQSLSSTVAGREGALSETLRSKTWGYGKTYTNTFVLIGATADADMTAIVAIIAIPHELPNSLRKVTDMAEGAGEGGYQQINKTLNAGAFSEYLTAQQAHLPSLPNVERLSERVVRVLGFNPGKVILISFVLHQVQSVV